MRSSTSAVAVGLLAIPLSLASRPAPAAVDPVYEAFNPADVTTVQVLDQRRFTDAPVSTLSPAGVSPVDRAAGPGSRSFDAGPINGTPFSDTPTGTLSEGGGQVTQSDRTLSPADTSGVTPNLGK